MHIMENLIRTLKPVTAGTDKFEQLRKIPGHPLQNWADEDEALLVLIAEARKSDADLDSLLPQIGMVAVHYDKLGDLLYPNLKVLYGIAGPHDNMWNADFEIRKKFSALMRKKEKDDAWKQDVMEDLDRMEEMAGRELETLFPLSARTLSKEDWKHIYYDSKDFADCFGVKRKTWEEGETFEPLKPEILPDDVIQLGGGRMTLKQLNDMLDALPLEITFINDDDINCYYNVQPKIFKRPSMSLGRKVYDCHPNYTAPMAKHIIDSFKSKEKDKVEIWMEKMGEPYHVTYMAVRDKDGNYVGTLELIQNMEFAKKHYEDTFRFEQEMEKQTRKNRVEGIPVGIRPSR